MGTYSKKENIDDFKIEYQIIKRIDNSIEGRAIISGPLCSSATTCSTIPDLSWNKFASEQEALDSLKATASEKIRTAINFHTESCNLCKKK